MPEITFSKKSNYSNQFSNNFEIFLQARGQGNHTEFYPVKWGSVLLAKVLFFFLDRFFLVDSVKNI